MSSTGEKEQAVMEYKMEMDTEQLCTGLPVEFVSYFEGVRSLEHGMIPNYPDLRQMIRRMAMMHGVEFDCVFEWTVRMYQQRQSKQTSYGKTSAP